MTNKVYHLSTCTTCKRILAEVNLPENFVQQDIKATPISEIQLDELKEKTGSYEALFNKRARLYKEKGLKDKTLTEQDFRTLLLEHYTFLKRPVFIVNNEVFVGNSKKTVEALKKALHE